jgi:ferredoxin, 2Fe-2S
MAQPLTQGGRVDVAPSGLQFPVAPEETVMDAAHRAGLHWPTVCGGNANCGVCMSTVLAGDEYCAPIGAEERETLARVARGAVGANRLVCRLTVNGPVHLRRRGVRPDRAAG